MIGEDLNMSRVEGKWEGIEEADKTIPVMGFLQLNFDLLDLGRLTEDMPPKRR